MKTSPRSHFKQSDRRCDQVDTLFHARRHSKVADMNAVAGAQSDWNLHWANGPSRNGYDFILVGHTKLGREIRREMTNAEKNLDVAFWADKDIAKWRKTLSPVAPRKSSKQRKALHKDRPSTVRWRSVQARALGVTIGWELKSPAYGNSATLVDRFIKAASTGRGLWFAMTLGSMANAAGKRTLFTRKGIHFVMLGRVK